MARGLRKWSKTAATNSSADSGINWAEGMAPSAVNDSARAEMASMSMWRDDNNGTLAGTLSTATYSVTSNQTFDAYAAGDTVAFQLSADMPATALVNVDSLGAKPLRPIPGTDFAGGEYKANQIIRAVYLASNSGEFVIIGHREPGSEANSIVTANITNAAVTYAKIQNVTNNRLLGNFSGSAAAPSEYSITGPNVSGSAIAFPAPVAGSFKNLSIKVATTTTVTVAADFVVTTDGTNYQTTALSGTINLGTNGAANALDAGTIAIDTWYAVWAIAKSDGTTAALASTSSTAPTMPTGYTFKARIGWVRTIHASATLYGTWQLGRTVQYIVGLAQTAAPITMTGTTMPGASWTAVSVSNFVPSTASRIFGGLWQTTGTGAAAACAPDNNAAYTLSPTTAPSYVSGAGNATAVSPFNFLLESTNIYWQTSGIGSSQGGINCLGWEDNI